MNLSLRIVFLDAQGNVVTSSEARAGSAVTTVRVNYSLKTFKHLNLDVIFHKQDNDLKLVITHKYHRLVNFLFGTICRNKIKLGDLFVREGGEALQQFLC